MVGIGQTLSIQGELYEVVRTLRVKMGSVLPSEHITDLKELWHAEKAFKQGDHYYFVNEIQTIEPITDDENRSTREATVDSTEDTAGGQMDLGGGDGGQEEHN